MIMRALCKTLVFCQKGSETLPFLLNHTLFLAEKNNAVAIIA